MLKVSMVNKLKRILAKGKFGISEKSKSRIKGLHNISAGYTFRHLGDDYYLYWTCGNMNYRGMPKEKQDEKTMEMFRYLTEIMGLKGLVLGDIYNQKAIRIEPEE